MVTASYKKYHGVNRESIHPGDSINVENVENQYEAQYDPNNDFKIFGVGDHTKGGI
jgi:hypothetical protein